MTTLRSICLNLGFLSLLGAVAHRLPTAPRASVPSATSTSGGGQLQWVQTFGGDEGDFVSDVVCHTNGSVFATGEFWGRALFPSAPGGTTGTYLNAVGEADSFLARYDTNGNLMWVTKIGGLYSDRGIQVELVTISGTLRVRVRGTGFGKVRAYPQGNVQVWPPVEILLADEATFQCVYSLTGTPQSITLDAFDTFDPPSTKIELDPAQGSLEVGWFDFALPLSGASLASAGGRDFYLAEWHPDPTSSGWVASWALAGGGQGTDWATAAAYVPGQASFVVGGSFEETATFTSLGGSAQMRTAADDDVNDANERPDAFLAKYTLGDCDMDGIPDLSEGTSGCP